MKLRQGFSPPNLWPEYLKRKMESGEVAREEEEREI